MQFTVIGGITFHDDLHEDFLELKEKWLKYINKRWRKQQKIIETTSKHAQAQDNI
jgi:hypothetical protein